MLPAMKPGIIVLGRKEDAKYETGERGHIKPRKKIIRNVYSGEKDQPYTNGMKYSCLQREVERTLNEF